MSTATATTKPKRTAQNDQLTENQLKEIHGIIKQINESWRQYNKDLKRMFAKYNQ